MSHGECDAILYRIMTFKVYTGKEWVTHNEWCPGCWWWQADLILSSIYPSSSDEEGAHWPLASCIEPDSMASTFWLWCDRITTAAYNGMGRHNTESIVKAWDQ